MSSTSLFTSIARNAQLAMQRARGHGCGKECVAGINSQSVVHFARCDGAHFYKQVMRRHDLCVGDGDVLDFWLFCL